MPTALVVGEYDEGDSVVGAIEERATKLGYDIVEEKDYRIAGVGFPD